MTLKRQYVIIGNTKINLDSIPVSNTEVKLYSLLSLLI